MDPLICLIIQIPDPQMLAPIIGGLLFDFVGYSSAALFIAGWNLVSVVVEYMLLILIYNDRLFRSDIADSSTLSRKPQELCWELYGYCLSYTRYSDGLLAGIPWPRPPSWTFPSLKFWLQ